MKLKKTFSFLIWISALAILTVMAQFDFLLFHVSVEFFSIIIACGIFMIAWNSMGRMENDYLLFLGIAYLFIAILDFLHTLTYKGMGIFPFGKSDLPTQLWITARYFESICLLIAPIFIRRKLNYRICFITFATISSLLIYIIFKGNIFPVCYKDGVGLTSFKVLSEYIICLILVISMINLKKMNINLTVRNYIVASIIATILSEMAFTCYINVYGLFNIIGHFLKIISFFLIYKAIVETGIKHPLDLLFHDLQTRERELSKALSEIKTLKGIVPICSFCKKIRDDNGYWEKVETYVKKHSHADFSHGICPDCAKKHYPELNLEVSQHEQ